MPTLTEIYQNLKNQRDGKGSQVKPFVLEDFTLYPGQLAVVGSRSGVGRSTFMLYLLQVFAEQCDDGFLLISNEESEELVFKKLVCQISSIPFKDIDSVMDEVMITHRKVLTSEKIILQYNSAPWENQKEFILDGISRYNLKCLMIDKIQSLYCTKRFNNRDQEIDYIVNDLKQIAREHNIAIVLASTINRSSELRDGKMPLLSDLRGSGSLEGNSDIVLLLHRPDYYGITQDADGNSLIGIVFGNILKNRNGKSTELKFHFIDSIPQIKRFESYDKFSFVGEFNRIHHNNEDRIEAPF